MKILSLEEEGDSYLLKASMKKEEFRNLLGIMDGLIIFASQNIDVPTKAIKTGARHSFARYLLLPISIRKLFKTETHDFDDIKVGMVEFEGDVYVVYRVMEKRGVASQAILAGKP